MRLVSAGPPQDPPRPNTEQQFRNAWVMTRAVSNEKTLSSNNPDMSKGYKTYQESQTSTICSRRFRTPCNSGQPNPHSYRSFSLRSNIASVSSRVYIAAALRPARVRPHRRSSPKAKWERAGIVPAIIFFFDRGAVSREISIVRN
jgi:hypothetical protein